MKLEALYYYNDLFALMILRWGISKCHPVQMKCFVYLQMYKAGDVASTRGAKLIGIEDILFLMRKDKVAYTKYLDCVS